MKIVLNKLPKSRVELTIELSVEELTPFLNQAAQQLAQKNKIAGFNGLWVRSNGFWSLLGQNLFKHFYISNYFKTPAFRQGLKKFFN